MTSLTMEQIHEAGVKRHPNTWFVANQKAVTVLMDSPMRIDSDVVRRTVSLMVLRILDAVEESGSVEESEPSLPAPPEAK